MSATAAFARAEAAEVRLRLKPDGGVRIEAAAPLIVASASKPKTTPRILTPAALLGPKPFFVMVGQGGTEKPQRLRGRAARRPVL